MSVSKFLKAVSGKKIIEAINSIIDALLDKEDKLNKVTSLASDSTDAQYPSAKCVYDVIQNIIGGNDVIIDADLSNSSTNPVQNSTLSKEFENKQARFNCGSNLAITQSWNSSTISSTYLYDIVYAKSIFIAVGAYSSTSYVAISSDKENWNVTTYPKSTAYSLDSICYGKGKFVTVGHEGVIRVSEDYGATWIQTAALVLTNTDHIPVIRFYNDKFWVFSSRYVAYSDDATTWHIETLSTNFLVEDDVNSYFSRCNYAYGGGKFVVIDICGLYYSDDGKTYTQAIGNRRDSIHLCPSVAYLKDKFVAIYNNGSGKAYCRTSYNGINWNNPIEIGDIATANFSNICYKDDQYIALFSNGYYAISTDLTNWTIYQGSCDCTSIIYGQGALVGVRGRSIKQFINTLNVDMSSKANDNAVVHLTGDETISGTKTFSIIKATGYIDTDFLVVQSNGGSGYFAVKGYTNGSSHTPAKVYFSYDSTDGNTSSIDETTKGHLSLNAAPNENTTSSLQIDTVGARNTALSGKANSADLATVATSGSYNDLSNKPTIPTNLSGFTDDLGSSPTHTHSQYLTSVTSHNQASSTINALTSYSKSVSGGTGALSTSDTLNKALAKLENALDGKQASGSYAASSHTHTKSNITDMPTKLSQFTDDLGTSPTHTHSQYLTSHQSLSGYVPTSTTINGKALTSNISLTASDVGAATTITITYDV